MFKLEYSFDGGEIMGNFIIKRCFSVVHENAKIITLTIDQPKEEVDSDWVCHFHIEGVDKEPMHYSAYGLDALQALLNALEGVRMTLRSFNLSMTWEGGNEGDIGIPRLVPMILTGSYINDIDGYIDQKLEDFYERNRK